MGYTTMQEYDVEGCASQCDAMNGCMAINVLFERDPSLDPDTGCVDAPSVTMIKCVFVIADMSPNHATPAD